MEFTVQSIAPPKPDKVLAYIKTSTGDVIGFHPAKFNFQSGKSYDCTVSESEWPVGSGRKTMRIESQKEIKAAAPASGSSAAPAYTDRYWMPFVSNTVAHAIMSGLIKEPLDIFPWATAAKAAALKLDQPEREAGQDDDEPQF